MANKRKNRVVRNQKDTLYRKVFSEKENILSLYNALNDSHYENADDIEVCFMFLRSWKELQGMITFMEQS